MQKHGLMPTTFGIWAMDDSRFVFDLRNGRSCQERTMRKVRKFMTEYQLKQRAKFLRILNPRYEDDPRVQLEEMEDKCA